MTFSNKLKASAFATFFIATCSAMVMFTNCGRAVLGGLDSSSTGDATQSVAVGTSSCPTGQVAVGLGPNNAVICAPLISRGGDICPTNSSVYLTSTDPATKQDTVYCVTNTSWDQSGTGTMCSIGAYLISYSTTGAIQCGVPTTTATCPTGYYLNGIVAGQPSCLAVPASTPSAIVCPTGSYLANLTNSVPDCEDRIWANPATTASCPAGKYALGWSNGSLICRDSVFNTSGVTTACAPGLILLSYTAGAAVCNSAPNPDLSLACRSGFQVAGVSQGIVVCDPTPSGSQECGPGQFVTGIANGQVVCSTVATNSLPGACPRSTYPMGVSNGSLVCAGFDNTRYATSTSLCTPGDVTLCAVAGGIGHQTCSASGSSYSTCLADSCSAGYQAQNGVCQPQQCQPGTTQTCAIANGSGTQACGAQGTWGTCQVQTCDAGYFMNNGACSAVTCSPGQTLPCTDGAGFGARTCAQDGSGYGSCTITSCQNGYTLQGAACVDTTAPRITITQPADPSSGNTLTMVYAAIDNESGVAGLTCALDNVALSNCQSPLLLTGLTSGSHTFKVTAKDKTGNVATQSVTWTQQVCDGGSFRSCAVSHGAGQQACQADGTYAATCVPATCENGYQAQNNACVSLTCGEGFSAVGNACVDNIAPAIQIIAKPSDPLIAGNATVQFSATDTGSGVATISCSLDGGAASACQNPVSLGSIAAGAHSLVISAVDHANNAAKVEVDWHQYACAPGAQVSCQIANGTGAQTCAADGSAYGACQVTACSQGFVSQGGQCVYVPKTCVGPDGQKIANGQAITYYAASTVAPGATCQSESRSCSDGVLSGSFTQASCRAQAATKVPLYRFFNPWSGEHFYTANYWEGGVNPFMAYEGVGFNVIAENLPGTAPLFRCWTGAMHMVSRQPNCESGFYVNEGTYGYVYTAPTSGARALQRYFSPRWGDHLITTSPETEFIFVNGYHREDDLGYVP